MALGLESAEKKQCKNGDWRSREEEELGLMPRGTLAGEIVFTVNAAPFAPISILSFVLSITIITTTHILKYLFILGTNYDKFICFIRFPLSSKKRDKGPLVWVHSKFPYVNLH